MCVMSFSWSPADINECKTGRNTCANDTVCFNLDGGYDCRCPHGHNCTGDCIHDGKVKHSGQIWVLDSDRCSVCSCQVRDGGGGVIMHSHKSLSLFLLCRGVFLKVGSVINNTWGGSHIFCSVLCFHINMFFVFLLLLSKYAESSGYYRALL